MVKQSLHIALALRHAATLAIGSLDQADRAALRELLSGDVATAVPLATHLLGEAERFLDPPTPQQQRADLANMMEHRLRTLARMVDDAESGIDDYIIATRVELDDATAAETDRFTPKELRRRRARLERRLAHLRNRQGLQENDPRARHDISEASALQTALVLYDDALAMAEARRG